MVRGLLENNKKEDQDLASEIVKEKGCHQIEITSTMRLSRKEGGPKIRPLRVTLKNQETKNEILRKSAKVRQVNTELYNPKTVLIVPDQTKLEREAYIALRAQLIETIAKKPEQHVKNQSRSDREHPTKPNLVNQKSTLKKKILVNMYTALCCKLERRLYL